MKGVQQASLEMCERENKCKFMLVYTMVRPLTFYVSSSWMWL